MIEFKYIKYANFIGAGNYVTEIELNTYDSTMITGSNGAGKSTILDALSFVLFGKPFRKINKSQLVNSVTKKNCRVETEFLVGSVTYKVVRGIKPNVFEIYKDGSLLPQDSKTDYYQDYLERHILRCNHKSFCQVVVLGSASYVPFLELGAPERRVVVENILDLEVISIMNVILKRQAVATMESIREGEGEKSLISNEIRLLNENLLKMQNQVESDIEEYLKNIQELEAKATALRSKILEFEALGIVSHADEIVNYSNELLKLKQCGRDAQKKMQELTAEIEFYKSNCTCSVCKQAIDYNFKMDMICQKEKLIGENKQLIVSYTKEWTELSEVIDKLQEEENKCEEVEENKKYFAKEIKNITLQIYKWKSMIAKKQQVTSVDVEQLETLNKRLSSANEALDALYKQKSAEQSLLKILKDDGVKAKIIEQYINLINELVNNYLYQMEFLCEFQLDGEFNESIKSRYRDTFSFASFSEGEKLRITLAILFTWREIAKRRNSIATNILFFDEILCGSMDAEGISNFIKIINNLTSNSNVFLITHNADTAAMGSNSLHFEKIKGFSHVSQKAI